MFGGHLQSGFLLGERKKFPVLDKSYFNHVDRLKNYYIRQDGSAKRRNGTKVVTKLSRNFESTNISIGIIEDIVSLGELYIVLNKQGELFTIKESGESVKLELVAGTKKTYKISDLSESGSQSQRLSSNITVNTLVSSFYNTKVIKISLLNGAVWALVENGLPYLVTIEDDLLSIRDYYITNSGNPLNDFISAFPLENSEFELPNPFYKSDDSLDDELADNVEIVIGKDVDLDANTCKIWLDSRAANPTKVKPSVVGMEQFIGRPFFTNVKPSSGTDIGSLMQVVDGETTTVTGSLSTGSVILVDHNDNNNDFYIDDHVPSVGEFIFKYNKSTKLSVGSSFRFGDNSSLRDPISTLSIDDSNIYDVSIDFDNPVRFQGAVNRIEVRVLAINKNNLLRDVSSDVSFDVDGRLFDSRVSPSDGARVIFGGRVVMLDSDTFYLYDLPSRDYRSGQGVITDYYSGIYKRSTGLVTQVSSAESIPAGIWFGRGRHII